MDISTTLASLNAVSDADFTLNYSVRAEKSKHLHYLTEFRTKQCRPFVEHKCQHHRPFNCFNWHFPNQLRRQPIKRSDGTFNYNPDVYCTKYDENTGICVDGENCPYVHRNAGDTERRYHPRYFKTGICIFETTEEGHCMKNGIHCAFAHGTDDLRPPVYDIREAQSQSDHNINLPASLEKERVLSEDPKWNDVHHVLAHYKTELCKKPPRMCRQGYACPFYHNNKDKRRNPAEFRYRSTPCPNVKPADEWLDCGLCEVNDACAYCHTRTEQQFHPEIYKSTKCNDMLHNGYCPRGPFCAFAHEDQEMHIGREFINNISTNTTNARSTPTVATTKEYKSSTIAATSTGDVVSLVSETIARASMDSIPTNVDSHEYMTDLSSNSVERTLHHLNNLSLPASRSALRLNTIGNFPFMSSSSATAATLLQTAYTPGPSAPIASWAAGSSMHSPVNGTGLTSGSPLLSSNVSLPQHPSSLPMQLLAQRYLAASSQMSNPQALGSLLMSPGSAGTASTPSRLIPYIDNSGLAAMQHQFHLLNPANRRALNLLSPLGNTNASGYQMSGSLPSQLTAFGQHPSRRRTPSSSSTSGKVRHVSGYTPPAVMSSDPLIEKTPVLLRGLAKNRPLIHSQPPMETSSCNWLVDFSNMSKNQPTTSNNAKSRSNRTSESSCSNKPIAQVSSSKTTDLNASNKIVTPVTNSDGLQQAAMNMESILGNALGESYRFSELDLNELNNLPEEEISEEQFYQHPSHNVSTSATGPFSVVARTESPHMGGASANSGNGRSRTPVGHCWHPGVNRSAPVNIPPVNAEDLTGYSTSSEGPSMSSRVGSIGSVGGAVCALASDPMGSLVASGAAGMLDNEMATRQFYADRVARLTATGGSGSSLASSGVDGIPIAALCGTPLSMDFEQRGEFTSPNPSYMAYPYADNFAKMSHSPFSNAACDIERLTLQQQLDQCKAQLDTANDELESTKQERDEAILRLEACRRLIYDFTKIQLSATPSVGEPIESCSEPLLQTLTNQMIEAMSDTALTGDPSVSNTSSNTLWENNNKPVLMSSGDVSTTSVQPDSDTSFHLQHRM